MLSWFNWHAPVITPAQGFVAIVAVIVLDIVVHIIAKLVRGAQRPDVDPLSDAPGDWPYDGRRG